MFKIKQNWRIIFYFVEAYKKNILRKFSEFNLRADIIMYNIVIRLFCEMGDMVMAYKLTKDMSLIDLLSRFDHKMCL